MPSAGPWAARLSEVAISTNDGVAYNDIEKVNSPRLSGSNDTAETSNNDSGGHKEFIPTWSSLTLTFEMVADEAATYQEAVWSAFLNKTTPYWRLRPKGNVSTEKELFGKGIVTSIEENLDKGDKASYSVTVQMTGAPTRQNQA
jgi:hypothetical protein